MSPGTPIHAEPLEPLDAQLVAALDALSFYGLDFTNKSGESIREDIRRSEWNQDGLLTKADVLAAILEHVRRLDARRAAGLPR